MNSDRLHQMRRMKGREDDGELRRMSQASGAIIPFAVDIHYKPSSRVSFSPAHQVRHQLVTQAQDLLANCRTLRQSHCVCERTPALKSGPSPVAGPLSGGVWIEASVDVDGQSWETALKSGCPISLRRPIVAEGGDALAASSTMTQHMTLAHSTDLPSFSTSQSCLSVQQAAIQCMVKYGFARRSETVQRYLYQTASAKQLNIPCCFRGELNYRSGPERYAR